MILALALIAAGLLGFLVLACWKASEARELADDLLVAIGEAEADLLREKLRARANKALADARDQSIAQISANLTRARLERDDAHTSLGLVLDELARRERSAVKYAAPTLAAAMLTEAVSA